LIKRLKTKAEELKKKEISQWEKYSEENMPKEIFDILNEKVLKEKAEVEQALCQAYESMPEPEDHEEKLLHFKDALEALSDPNVSAEKKNKLLKACIERIEYHRDKPERIRSTAKRVTVNGRRIKPDGLPSGANWTNPPIEIDVKLMV
jgi:hypothetical protein